MSTLADLLNAPAPLEFEGAIYQVRQPTVLDMGLFARWLETRARESVTRATDLDADTARQLLRDVTCDIAAGVYEWGGEACCRALQSNKGQAKYLSIVLREQGVSEELAERIIAQRMKDVVALLQAASTDDPKALAEALTTLGLPSDFVSCDSSTPRSTGRKPKSRRSPSPK